MVLVGSQTASRRYVKYEIEQSLAKGNGLVAVHIHGIKDQRGKVSAPGRNPLEDFQVENDGLLAWIFPTIKASEKFIARDWVEDDGYRNLNSWIEDAATKVNR